jgi:hypothetical protein
MHSNVVKFAATYRCTLLQCKTFLFGAHVCVVCSLIQCCYTIFSQCSVWLRARRSRFDPRQRRKNFSSNLCVQTGSGAHPASCSMGTGDPSPGLKRGRGVMLTTHPHLVPRWWMSKSYTSSPPCASIRVLWDWFIFFTDLFWPACVMCSPPSNTKVQFFFRRKYNAQARITH